MLLRAIACFKTQTYKNKELLVMFETDNKGIQSVIEQEKNEAGNIRFIEVPITQKLSLGELKNKAIELAVGTYFCQWDDDDWYACDRLQIQMEAMLKDAAQVCFLGHWIFYDSIKATAYLSFRRNWEGSILCKKSIVNNEYKYVPLAKLEDTPFVNKISEIFPVTQVIKPSTYIYIYHGNNTWDYKHFKNNFDKGQQMSAAYSRLITDILNGVYNAEDALKMLDSEMQYQEMQEKIATSKVFN